jgi:hypothetical protein
MACLDFFSILELQIQIDLFFRTIRVTMCHQTTATVDPPQGSIVWIYVYHAYMFQLLEQASGKALTQYELTKMIGNVRIMFLFPWLYSQTNHERSPPLISMTLQAREWKWITVSQD